MAASHQDADVPLELTAHTPAGHASLQTPVEGAVDAGEAQSLVTASPAPVLITEQQVRFATAAVGAASNTAAIRQPWISLVWQRLSLRSSTHHEPRRVYPYRRSSYFEHAAMAREMERL
jgi:hypothetical protein